MQILNTGIHIDIRDQHGRTAFNYTIQGHSNTLEELLQRGADLSSFFHRQCTPLGCAKSYQYGCEIIRTLLKFGTDLKVSYSRGFTRLHQSSLAGPW